MKIALLGFFLLSFLFTSGNANQKTYHSGNVNDLVQTTDGGFILTGSLFENASSQIGLMKFDSAGNPQWLKSYFDQFEFYSYGQKVIPVSGGYYVGGIMFHDTISNEQITLYKCDTLGTLLWSKEFGNLLDDDEVGGMLLTGDGILLGGHCTNFGAGGEDFYLLKTDSSGNLRYSKAYGTGRHERGIVLLPYQQGFIFAGYAQETTGNNNDLILLILDSAANILNTIKFSLSGNQQLCDIAIDASDNILVAATTETTPHSPHALFIKLMANGNIAWSKFLQNDFSVPHKIRSVPGGTIVSGESYAQNRAGHAFVLELNDNGNSVTENYFGDTLDLTGQSFLINNDSFLLAGNYTKPGAQLSSIYVNNYVLNDTACNHYTRTSTFTDIFPVLSIESWQTLSPPTVETNSAVSGSMKTWTDSIVCDYNASIRNPDELFPITLMPNPAIDKTVLMVPYVGIKAEANLINPTGNTVKKFMIKSKKTTIETGDLPQGLYTLQILYKGMTFSSRLVIQN